MITRNLLSILALGVATAAVACGSSSESEGPASTEEVGSLGLKLEAGGVTLSSFHYVITGPGGFVRQADVSISGSSTLATLVGGLPVGTGFTVSLTAAAPNNALACSGSAGFDVTARQTTAVTVRLQCREPVRTGSVQVNGSLNQCPNIDSVSASPASVLVGNQLALSAAAHDTDVGPQALTYSWAVSSGTLTGATTQEPKLTCTTAGDVVVTLNVSDGDCGDTQTAIVSCTTPAGGGAMAKVVINEVESNGGIPGDWVELTNVGTAVADISGWKFKDNDDSRAYYLVPVGTLLAPGAYYLLEEAQFGFGLGGADSARLWDAAGAVVDSYAWTAHAAITYGRCPVGASFGFVQTPSSKGTANDCSGGGGSGGSGGVGGSGGSSGSSAGTSAGGTSSGGTGGTSSGGSGGSGGSGVSALAWPGTDAVVTVDELNYFGTNLSGLSYQPAAAGAPAVLWAVQNSPSKLFRLLYNGVSWVPDAENGWGSGKLMHYTTGTGAPDSEGVTKPDWAGSAMYVASERDNNNNGVSRLVILRIDSAAAGAELTATNEWNVTADLPVVGPNLSLEAITFVPDAALVAGGFFDEATHAVYNPATYANHGGGLFFVGVEGNGMVYAYALDHLSNTFVRVATISSGQVNIMDLAYDRETNLLWGWHDNTTAANKATVFRIDQTPGSPTRGSFVIARLFDHPATLPNANNEGITFGSEADCVAGQKPFFWSDDDTTAGHAIRRGSIPCGAFF